MERYALDLSLKKVEALRALTDAPDWFETIINKAAKKSMEHQGRPEQTLICGKGFYARSNTRRNLRISAKQYQTLPRSSTVK